jgi:NAD(P)-dependent dehydrogenase (short-subunit alcohol dehydrogenase family)
VADEITRRGGRSVACADSAGTFEAAERIVALARQEFGAVDILVNNAGITRDRMIFNMTESEWDAVLKVHLVGTFACLRAVLPSMRERRYGRVVNMISTAGLIGNVGQANYAAAKGGIVSLTRVCALDMAKYNVTANCVAPFAYTRLTESIKGANPAQVEYLTKAKMSIPEHVAPLVTYLASDLAHGVTGQIFGVRGKEIFLFSQPRPVHSVGDLEGWTPEKIARAMDSGFRSKLTPLETDLEVFKFPPLV